MKPFLRLLPNAVTLARIAGSVVFIRILCGGLFEHTVYLSPALYLLGVFIWLSDFADGRLARALRVESAIGARMDILADCSFIFPTLVVFNLSGIVPVWFTVVAALDFTGFLLTSRWLRKAPREPKPLFVFDRLGRLAAALFYTAPMLACETINYSALSGVLSAVFYLTAFLAAVSMAARFRTCLVRLPRLHADLKIDRL